MTSDAMTDDQTRPLAARIALSVLSGVLLALAFPTFGLPPIVWVAVVPLLFAVEGCRGRASYRLGFLAGLVFAAGRLWWLVTIFGPFAVALFAVLALWPGVFCAVFAAARRRWGILGAALLCPVAWVGMEFFSGECYYFKFTWLCLGYSQVANVVTRQFASLAGVYGLSFVIVGVNAALWAGLRPPWRVRRTATCAACAALLVSFVCLWGVTRRPPEQGRSVRVAAIQCGPDMWAEFERLSRQAATEGARLIVWPECAIFSKVLVNEDTLARLRSLCRQTDATLVLGCKTQAPAERSAFYNAAIILGPDGRLLGEYRKNVPVQFFNDGVPGRSAPAFPTPAGWLAMAICYDLGYSYVVRRSVQDGGQIIVAPTHDPPEWGAEQRMHAALTPMRAVEHRRWVVRPSLFGISQIVDPMGRVVRESKGRNPQMLTADVGLLSATTPYTRGGWLLAPVCLWITILLTLALLLVGRRRSRAETSSA